VRNDNGLERFEFFPCFVEELRERSRAALRHVARLALLGEGGGPEQDNDCEGVCEVFVHE
jgi:hypothetical protein